jgi:hypothetical protein
MVDRSARPSCRKALEDHSVKENRKSVDRFCPAQSLEMGIALATAKSVTLPDESAFLALDD